MSSLVVIAVLLVLLAAEILFQFFAVKLSISTFESRPPIGAELFPPDPSAEPATITTGDGLKLAGSLLRTQHEFPRGLILFCHELDSNRWSALLYCEGLLAAGFHVFIFDFRNHGDSDALAGYTPMHWATQFEIEDVRSVLAYIRTRPDLRHLPLGLFGMSRGGTVALTVAPACDSVRCVAADGAVACNELLDYYIHRWGRLYFPDWFLQAIPRWHVRISLGLIRLVSEFRKGYRYANVERALARLGRKPVLMISGERDTYIIPEITRRLHARTGQPDSGMWIVPDAKHNMARQTAPQEYDARLIEFFSLLDSAGGDAVELPGVTAASSNGRKTPVSAHSTVSPSG